VQVTNPDPNPNSSRGAEASVTSEGAATIS
jgi:hypothetical protein